MHILVTGAAGYIGSHTVLQLLDQNYHVTAIDNLSTGFLSTIHELQAYSKNFTFFKIDLGHDMMMEDIFKNNQFDAVIHFAANIDVAESVQKPIKYYLNNTVNTTKLIQLCVQYKVNKFIFSSTAATYGQPKSIPIHENSSQTPLNPYGSSKFMSEVILQDTAQSNPEFKFIILRYFNVAGANMKKIFGQKVLDATHLIKVATQTALGYRKQMAIFGDNYNTKDGTCIRDFIHVDDLASSHLSALDYLVTCNTSNIFNVGYGQGYSVKEIIEAVKRISGVDFQVNIHQRRAGDAPNVISDNTKIMQETNWKVNYNNLDTIILSSLEWEQKLLKDNRQ